VFVVSVRCWGIHRSQLYYEPVPETEENFRLMRMIDKQHLKTPFWGSRKMLVFTSKQIGRPVNRRRIQRLMRLKGMEGIAPGPSTTKRDSENPKLLSEAGESQRP
jgi:putative transposase